jgi:predicted XRE-type DNA-binding protein
MEKRGLDSFPPREESCEQTATGEGGRRIINDDRTITRSSGNVFADAGLPDADSQLVKAQPVSRIDAIIRERGLSQREAARILDVARPLSNILRGRFRGYSVERLMRMVTAFDRGVSIVVAEKSREAATIPVRAAVTIDKQGRA